VHVVYLGDARTEKGYHWLPRLVRDAMAANLPVRFTIQSNFNVPSGEPAAARARQELESLARDAPITLLLQPLNSEQYRRLLFDADVVLLPYDREAYRSRSSGVFAEALAAGKPLIVPKGTWMAGELAGAADNIGATYSDAGDLFHQLVELVRHNQRYRAAANTFAASWSNRHSPRKLIELLHRPAGLSLEANLI
jgi:glycosyltransferase involved in cell wall biosynthesis